MNDMLPDISVKVDCNPREFIERIEEIATQLPDFIEIHKELDSLGEEMVVNIKLSKQNVHIDGLFIARVENVDRVDIEIGANKWNPDPPTYDVYVEEAQRIIIPLLKEYNRKFNSKRRLNIQSKAETKPKLPPVTKQYFDSFVNCANKKSLHPKDWNRYYKFIRFCFAKRVSLYEEDIISLLIAEGFSKEIAKDLASIYRHGFGILRTYM